MEAGMRASEVSKMASVINQANDSFKKNIEQLRILNDELKNIWRGEDGTKFTTTFENVHLNSLTELNKIITDYGKYLANIPGAYAMLDEVYSNREI